nr:hypothetical protein [Tanacetum cinerariifolium]
MEESLSKFMTESAKRHDENFNFIKEIQASTDVAVKNQRALIKALEIQIGKMSKVLQEMRYGSLPSSTETNPSDHVKSISTCEEAEMLSIWRIRSHRYHASNQLKDDRMSLMELNRATIPFPGRLREYGNDMEEIKATMNSHYSTILNDTLPPKENNPWSFTLLFYINNMSFIKALTGLGASVSVMPYSTFTNLGLGELVPTKLIVELANRTKKRPKGIAKNVLVGNDKFVFPVNFIVLDMPEDIKVLLILGRPFLPTAHAKIDDVNNVRVPTTPKIVHSRKKGKPSKKLTTHNLVHLFKEGDIEQLLWDSIKETTHKENSNLIKDIRASTDAAIGNQGASIKTLEIQIGQISKVLQERGASVSLMPLSTYLNLGLGELAHTKLTVELADRTVKYPKEIAKNVLVEARLMGETLMLNRSLDPFFGDYIELNDLNVTLELRRDQVDDLMPTIEEGEVIDKFRARNDARMDLADRKEIDDVGGESTI